MIQKIMLGCGVLMTIGLFFIFRSLVRQVRAENAQMHAPEGPSPRK